MLAKCSNDGLFATLSCYHESFRFRAYRLLQTRDVRLPFGKYHPLKEQTVGDVSRLCDGARLKDVQFTTHSTTYSTYAARSNVKYCHAGLQSITGSSNKRSDAPNSLRCQKFHTALPAPKTGYIVNSKLPCETSM